VYRSQNIGSIIVGDENYGEGSSGNMQLWNQVYEREAVIVKSFARIHETNLKKQGMLALTFTDKATMIKLKKMILSILGLNQFYNW